MAEPTDEHTDAPPTREVARRFAEHVDAPPDAPAMPTRTDNAPEVTLLELVAPRTAARPFSVAVLVLEPEHDADSLEAPRRLAAVVELPLVAPDISTVDPPPLVVPSNAPHEFRVRAVPVISSSTAASVTPAPRATVSPTVS